MNDRFCLLFFIFGSNVLYRSSNICTDKLLYQFFCSFNDRIWNAGKFGNLNTITLICSALYNFSKKDYVISSFFYCNSIIVYSCQLSFQFCQFMIMSRKQGFCPQNSGIADMFNYCPRNRKSIKGAGSPANFI